MISPWLVYFISMLDNLQVLSTVGLAVCVAVAAVCVIIYFTESDYCFKDDNVLRICKKTIKISSCFIFLFCLILLFVPNSKQAAAIYLIPKVSQSQTLKEMPVQLLNLVNNLVKDTSNDK